MLYEITDELREELKRPLGLLIKSGNEAEYIKNNLINQKLVITVGDRTTELFILSGGKPKVEVVDLKEKRSRREKTLTTAEVFMRVKNDPGTITEESIEAIKNAISSKERVRIEIDGEEDLLGIPAIIYAPNGSFVLYGQPNEGLVVIKVDSSVKDKARKILSSMKKVQN